MSQLFGGIVSRDALFLELSEQFFIEHTVIFLPRREFFDHGLTMRGMRIVKQQRRGGIVHYLEIAADRDLTAARNPPHAVDDAIECALPASKRPHAIVRVAIAVERDFDAAQAIRREAVHDVFRQGNAQGMTFGFGYRF